MNRPEIDCPGDTISYLCTIFVSNSEVVNLMWRVYFPRLMPINITYNSTSKLDNVDYLSMNISSTLTRFSNENIESVIVLTVLRNSMNGTKLTCSITDFINDTANLNVDTTG